MSFRQKIDRDFERGMLAWWHCLLQEAAQHSVHPTGGSRRVFKRFAWLEAGSVKVASSRPAHPQVTLTVGQANPREIMREVSMSDEYRDMVFRSLNQKETDELIKIWQDQNRAEWTETAFDAIAEILQNRLGSLPEQNPTKPESINVSQTETESNLVQSSPQTIKPFSEKYPFLAGYLAYLIISIVVSFILSFSSLPRLVSIPLQLVAGFYVFKFVVQTFVSPQS